ncbi:unnamed protein product [Menidia menidia]|uniref:(Atlantic silverside) hypothetical protein n=1 Tax=Menidia menidia TaxID=238744 RepID=A0A8S4A5C7_9TELE|nr:unnamed protein product [Menidia menidia]
MIILHDFCQTSCTLTYRKSNIPGNHPVEILMEDYPRQEIHVTYSDGSYTTKRPLRGNRHKRYAPLGYSAAYPTTTATPTTTAYPTTTPVAPTTTTAAPTTTTAAPTTTTAAPTTTTWSGSAWVGGGGGAAGGGFPVAPGAGGGDVTAPHNAGPLSLRPVNGLLHLVPTSSVMSS